MGKSNKLGTFGGVFTPSVLTILGVILYLRLPWVVGNGGLFATLGIIIVAHIISVTTGLSISSVATDKRVGAGGPYYVLSRSMGLPIGGTIGLALFVGLAFSISLYVIGFSESFLAYIGVEATPFWIRVCGTATIVLLTIITFISTSLAIKTQYIILVLIVLSLFSIFFGDTSVQAEPLLEPLEGGPSLALVFGIFFPAVTGFTAGVNMSGDLEDAKKSIPRGTILSIAVGLIVYVAAAIFLAYNVDPDALRNDPEILLKVAAIPAFVVAGIWGATLSSALGSILGAPRILQSMSADSVTPKWFAKGYGPTREPRNALLLAFAVGEAGILIAELDIIARVVSMVFLAMYGFVNVACAIENWASPDFRPSFRIPTWVPLVGAVTCLLVMIQLDLVAMAGSMIILIALYGYLQRRRLTLESGDAWEGVWASLVREGLRRLSLIKAHPRNWRPNALVFTTEHESPVSAFAKSLVASAGVATEFVLDRNGDGELAKTAATDVVPGYFREVVETQDAFTSVDSLARFYGFNGVTPNSVVLPASLGEDDPAGFQTLLGDLQDGSRNVLVITGAAETDGDEVPDSSAASIDIWWHPETSNFAFAATMARFLSRSPVWRDHNIRFFLATTDTLGDDLLALEARRYLQENRLEAEVHVRHIPAAIRTPLDMVWEESSGAKLIVMGLPNAQEHLGATLEAGKTSEALLVLYRSASMFPPILRAARKTIDVPSEPHEGAELSAKVMGTVRLPELPELREVVTSFQGRMQDVFGEFHERCVMRLYAQSDTLLNELHLLLHASEGDRSPADALASFFKASEESLKNYLDEQIPDQRATLESQILDFMREERFVVDSRSSSLRVARPIDDFRLEEGDSPVLQVIKRRTRWARRVGRVSVMCKIPVTALERYYRQAAVESVLGAGVRQFHHDSIEMMTELGNILSQSRLSWGLTSETNDADVAKCVAEIVRVIEALQVRHRVRVKNHRWYCVVRGQELTTGFSEDIDRLDVRRLVRKERKAIPSAQIPGTAQTPGATQTPLTEMPDAWREQQCLLTERAVLGVRVGGTVDRLVSAARRLQKTDVERLGQDCLSNCTELVAALQGAARESPVRYASRLKELSEGFRPAWEPQSTAEALSAELEEVVEDLPESLKTLSDASVLQVMDGSLPELEVIEVPLRRAIDIVQRRELVAPVERALLETRAAELSAYSVIDDVARLAAFQIKNTPRAELGAAAEAFIPRVEQQLERLGAASEKVALRIDEGVSALLSATSIHAIGQLKAEVTSRDRYRHARSAERVARSVVSRGRTALGSAMTELLYRRSRGLLAARRLGTSRSDTAHVELRTLVEDAEPNPDLLQDLPDFYRQLFSATAAVGGSFLVERPEQAKAVTKAVTRWKRGAGAALVVVGEPGSGKSTVIQDVVRELGSPAIVRVQAPEGGSASLQVFRQTVGVRAQLSDPFGHLADRSIVVIDDMEMWWERRTDGLVVIEAILEGVRKHGKRIAFVIGTSEYAFSLLDRLVPLTTSSTAILNCEPFAADDLGQAIMRRHQSSGLKFETQSTTEDEIGDWGRARLFTRYFDYSAGNMGTALAGWLSHIESTDTETIKVRTPAGKNWDAIDDIDGDAKAVLLQLMLHREVSRDRLLRIFGRDEADVDRVVRDLLDIGLLSQSPSGTLSVNPAVRHQVGAHFLRRGLL